MNAMAEALQKAGYDTAKSEAYVLAVEILRDRRDVSPMSVQMFIARLKKKPHLIFQVVSESHLRQDVSAYLHAVFRDMHGSGVQTTYGSQTMRGPAQINAGNASAGPAFGAAHKAGDSQNLHGRSIDLAVMRTVAQAAAVTIMDTHRIRDGRAIGDVRFGELETLRATNAMEASLIRQIQKHAVPGSHDTKVRDLVKVETLQRMLQRAAEVADAS